MALVLVLVYGRGDPIFVTKLIQAGSNFSTPWNRCLIFFDKSGGASKNEAEGG
jgi:hypothetical protein